MRVRIVALILALLPPHLMAPAKVLRYASVLDVRGRQLDVFVCDGASAAFASPEIQLIVGTLVNFMKMVVVAYQPARGPKSVTKLDFIDKNGLPVQRVQFPRPGGKKMPAQYLEARKLGGIGRIGGSFLVDLVGQSA